MIGKGNESHAILSERVVELFGVVARHPKLMDHDELWGAMSGLLRAVHELDTRPDWLTR